MDLNVNVHVKIDPITVNHSMPITSSQQLDRMEHTMSVISDKLDAVEAAIGAATTRVQNDIATLQAQIADLQAKVDAGSATPEELARLDALRASVDAIDPTNPATLATAKALAGKRKP